MLFIPETPRPARYEGTSGLWEVRRGFISEQRASAAARVVISLVRSTERLNCVDPYSTNVNAVRGTGDYMVWIGSEDTTKNKRTVYGNLALKEYCKPLIYVVDKMKETFALRPDTDHITVFVAGPNVEATRHNDDLDGGERSIVALYGKSCNRLYDPEQGEVVFTQDVGDEYSFRPIQETGLSIDHLVRNYEPRIAIMMN